jgi:flagellin-specific chaperone FliS
VTSRSSSTILHLALAQLLDATNQQDPRPIDDVHRVLTILRDGWVTIAGASTSQVPVAARP